MTMSIKIRTFKYHIEQGLKSIWKNRLMSAASIATVAANAFILIVSLCLVLNLDYMLEQVENNVGISVFISNDTTEEELAAIQKKISEIDYVKSVDYVSPEDALKWAENSWGSDNDILTGLEADNPFPRSFDITLEGVKYQKEVIDSLERLQINTEKELLAARGLLKTETAPENEAASEIETAPQNTEAQNLISENEIGKEEYKFIGIEKIRHAQREAEMLITINTALRIVSIILILIMGVIAVTIIMNTIKLTVFIRKNEINIMKYIGATDWFIRWPFIVEGIIIGLIGALIPCLICSLCYAKIISVTNEKMSFLTNIAQFKSGFDIFSVIIPVTLILGMFLGTLGSITSIRKHLNV